MDFPSQKAHRLNRRKMGRGQYPTAASASISVMGSGNIVTIYCSSPVVVTGPVVFTVPPLTVATQSQPDPTIIVLIMSGPIAGLSWTMSNTQPNVKTPQGGPITGGNGTFSGTPPTLTSIMSVMNNGDATYTVTVDHPLTAIDQLVVDVNVQLYSPAVLNWIDMQPVVGGTAFSFNCHALTDATDCTLLSVLNEPNSVSATQPFNLHQGPIAIV